jgi:G:T-mismatch repair DNA endonuclease (very short patch repair protein)
MDPHRHFSYNTKLPKSKKTHWIRKKIKSMHTQHRTKRLAPVARHRVKVLIRLRPIHPAGGFKNEPALQALLTKSRPDEHTNDIFW